MEQVRTIVDQPDWRDRTSRKYLERIKPDVAAERTWLAKRRARNALPRYLPVYEALVLRTEGLFTRTEYKKIAGSSGSCRSKKSLTSAVALAICIWPTAGPLDGEGFLRPWRLDKRALWHPFSSAFLGRPPSESPAKYGGFSGILAWM
jgi:hypothetical protein